MKNFDYCTLIVTGIKIENKKDIAEQLEFLGKSISEVGLTHFSLEKAKSKLVRGASTQAEVLRNILDRNIALNVSFYNIMVETFLHETEAVGPILFNEFPSTIEHARCLRDALSVFGRDLVYVLNFNPSDDLNVKDVSDFFRYNTNYVFYDIANERPLSPHQG